MFGLSENILKLLQDYFSAHPEILEVYVYGSRAMGRERPGSDIDLAVITDSKKDISATIQTDLDELSTPYLFDIVDYNHITHQGLRDHIDRVGKQLYKKII